MSVEGTEGWTNRCPGEERGVENGPVAVLTLVCLNAFHARRAIWEACVCCHHCTLLLSIYHTTAPVLAESWHLAGLPHLGQDDQFLQNGCGCA